MPDRSCLCCAARLTQGLILHHLPSAPDSISQLTQAGLGTPVCSSSEDLGLISIMVHVMLHCNCSFPCPLPHWNVGSWRWEQVVTSLTVQPLEGRCAGAQGRNCRVIKSWVSGLAGLSQRNRMSGGFRKWGRGRLAFCDFRMSKLQMGEETPLNQWSFSKALPHYGKTGLKPGLVTAQSLLRHHRVHFKSPGRGHSAAGRKSSQFSFWGP